MKIDKNDLPIDTPKYITPTWGTNTQAIIRKGAKGACVFLSQRALMSDRSDHLLTAHSALPLKVFGI